MLAKIQNLKSRKAGQRGVVLIIALIVLVAMTLAALALIRSVDTSTLIAGNLAFKQAATHSADTGVEAAAAWLGSASLATLESDSETQGYRANGNAAANSPAAGQSWDDYWNAQGLSAKSKLVTSGNGDEAGNTVSYVIDRLCNSAGGITTGASCTASPVVTVASGNGEEGGEVQLQSTAVVYYRITVRVVGPKNTVSYVQAVVSL